MWADKFLERWVLQSHGNYATHHHCARICYFKVDGNIFMVWSAFCSKPLCLEIIAFCNAFCNESCTRRILKSKFFIQEYPPERREATIEIRVISLNSIAKYWNVCVHFRLTHVLAFGTHSFIIAFSEMTIVKLSFIKTNIHSSTGNWNLAFPCSLSPLSPWSLHTPMYIWSNCGLLVRERYKPSKCF